jgi:hypothetical protein
LESPDLYDKFEYVAKNIEQFLKTYFHSQISRNHFLKDRHFNSITNSLKETLELAEFINFITLLNTFWDSRISLLADGGVGI